METIKADKRPEYGGTVYWETFRKPACVGKHHWTGRRWSAGTLSSEVFSWWGAGAEHPQLSGPPSSALSAGTSTDGWGEIQKSDTNKLGQVPIYITLIWVAVYYKMDCLPLFLYQRSLPLGDEASSASSSWSRRHSGFWGASCQKCQFWCLLQWQTSGEPCAEELCSKQGGLVCKKKILEKCKIWPWSKNTTSINDFTSLKWVILTSNKQETTWELLEEHHTLKSKKKKKKKYIYCLITGREKSELAKLSTTMYVCWKPEVTNQVGH